MLQGFPPVFQAQPKLLILGSMPGAASLAAQRYYAHPRNAFWLICAQLLDFDPALAYEARIEALTTRGIALWDVVHQCRREGSLDASIEATSVVANDVAGFLREHSSLRHVAFNGQAAAKLFRRHITLPDDLTAAVHLLPSTSPAHAALGFEQKCAAWRTVFHAAGVMILEK